MPLLDGYTPKAWQDAAAARVATPTQLNPLSGGSGGSSRGKAQKPKPHGTKPHPKPPRAPAGSRGRPASDITPSLPVNDLTLLRALGGPAPSVKWTPQRDGISFGILAHFGPYLYVETRVDVARTDEGQTFGAGIAELTVSGSVGQNQSKLLLPGTQKLAPVFVAGGQRISVSTAETYGGIKYSGPKPKNDEATEPEGDKGGPGVGLQQDFPDAPDGDVTVDASTKIGRARAKAVDFGTVYWLDVGT